MFDMGGNMILPASLSYSPVGGGGGSSLILLATALALVLILGLVIGYYLGRQHPASAE